MVAFITHDNSSPIWVTSQQNHPSDNFDKFVNGTFSMNITRNS